MLHQFGIDLCHDRGTNLILQGQISGQITADSSPFYGQYPSVAVFSGNGGGSGNISEVGDGSGNLTSATADDLYRNAISAGVPAAKADAAFPLINWPATNGRTHNGFNEINVRTSRGLGQCATLDSQNVVGARRSTVTGDRATIVVSLSLDLPIGLREDRLARSPVVVGCAVHAEISLDAGARRVDVTLEVDNAARDHRLRVLCDTGTRALTHVVGAAFAWLDRPTRVSGRSGWIEQPTAERCVHDLVAIDGALAIGVDGLREYAVIGDGRTIAITLLRGVGWLSRGDMPERRGHAGPALETPSAQGIGARAYRYCVVPLSGEMTLARAGREIHEFLSPVRLTHGARAVGPLLELPRDSAVQVSALRSGPGGELVLRLFNPRAHEENVTIRFASSVTDARAVDLREGDLGLGNTGFDVIRTAQPPLVEDGALTVRLLAYEIGTYLVRLA